MHIKYTKYFPMHKGYFGLCGKYVGELFFSFFFFPICACEAGVYLLKIFANRWVLSELREDLTPCLEIAHRLGIGEQHLCPSLRKV